MLTVWFFFPAQPNTIFHVAGDASVVSFNYAGIEERRTHRDAMRRRESRRSLFMARHISRVFHFCRQIAAIKKQLGGFFIY